SSGWGSGSQPSPPSRRVVVITVRRVIRLCPGTPALARHLAGLEHPVHLFAEVVFVDVVAANAGQRALGERREQLPAQGERVLDGAVGLALRDELLLERVCEAE